DDAIVHVDGDLGPARDIETINLELIFADIDILDRRIERTTKALKGDKLLAEELDFLERLKTHLEEGKAARSLTCDADEAEILASMPLLSMKPVIYVANMGENDFKGVDQNVYYAQVNDAAKTENAGVLAICAGLEAEIAGMEPEDKLMFLGGIGLESSGLDRMIQAGYELLGLISYLTAGKPEVRAWTIKRGTLAPQAAGKIHTDFERGFIRAEVVAFDDLKAVGSMNAAKEKGLVRSEGKAYEIKDGDVVLFRFNV
ncbi:MAG: YchF family ATPase, partial [Oscillospiraceae bacterium]|nr:YchF family ATPase [Oscillospiraceae bacterium]